MPDQPKPSVQFGYEKIDYNALPPHRQRRIARGVVLWLNYLLSQDPSTQHIRIPSPDPFTTDLLGCVNRTPE